MSVTFPRTVSASNLFRRQTQQRLAYRRPTDGKLLHQRAFIDERTRLQVTAQDSLSNGLIGDARGADIRNARGADIRHARIEWSRSIPTLPHAHRFNPVRNHWYTGNILRVGSSADQRLRQPSAAQPAAAPLGMTRTNANFMLIDSGI